ncbi:MAG: ABC transporter permease [Clostridiales bacterium]|nr:ABC transporter permease [Clostridiales bacterium]
MGTILKKELLRTRFGLVIWGIVVGILAIFALMEYPIVSQQLDTLEKAMAAIPKIGQLIFGVYNADLHSYIGYHVVMYYWIGLIVFTHAIYTGASVISKESRDKTAEYLFTKPIKRSAIVWAKIFAGFINVLLIATAATAMSLVGMMVIANDPAIYVQVLISGVGMLLTQCVLMSFGLLCSAISKSYGSATKRAITVLIASYCLMFLVQYFEVPSLNFLSPLAYFGVADVVANGPNLMYVLLSAAVIAACLYLTQKLYAAKEIAL